MFSKLFFFLVILCVVNASVLTVNVFDDDPKDEVASSPKDCNPQVCDQLCRRLKLTGGTCVRGRCKCDHFLNVEDDISEEEPSDLENMVLLHVDEPEAEVQANPRKCRDKACNWLCRAFNNTSGACVNGRCKCTKSVVAEDDPEAEVAANPSRCRDRACDSVCRALNNTSGACVDGRCKCTKSIVAEDAATDTDVEDSVLSRACNNKRCNQICRKQKFRGGACVGSNCYCNKFLSQQEDTMTDPAESLHSCNSIACDDKCRRTGWHSGVCINGQCKCDYFLNTDVSEDLEDSVTPKRCTQQACNNRCHGLGYRAGVCTGSRCSCFLNDNFFDTEDEVGSELSEDQNERGCNQQACEQLRRRLKFPGGACVNGRCKCDNFFGTEDSVDQYSELDERRVCNITKCNRTCTRRGYEGAKCINGRCKCYNKIQKKEDIPETSSPVSELLEDQNERGCNQQACEKLCRRLKFPGGACVNGRCKCDKYFGTEDAVDEYSELDGRRGCRITKCKRTCTRLGYDSATCVNRRCKCYNKAQADIPETSFPISKLSEDENERGCNQRACHQLCRILKFPGGACVNGRCKCNNFFGTEVDAVDEFPELETRRICKIRQCNLTCTRRGYERSRCVNGWCKCYNKIQREDASPLYEVTSDENEEPNEILRTNEGEIEELTDASLRACNTKTCNELCRRQQYAGGRCRFGQCRCFKKNINYFVL